MCRECSQYPFCKYLFASSDDTIAQTDIVMLLTPRIIRTHEFTARDLNPIYVGTNQNFGLTGPPPLIAAPPVEEPPPGTAPSPPAPGAQTVPPITPAPSAPPTGAPGQFTAPAPQPPASPLQPPAATPQSQVAPPVEPQVAASANTTTLAPTAQVSITAPTGEVRVGAGPYMVPIYVTNVTRASTITLTVTYNPAILRMRMVQEGSFLRQPGNANVVFTPDSNVAQGRVDLAFVRTGDSVGASGMGLLAALQFDAVGTGTTQVTISGVMQNPAGGLIPVRFSPASINVR